MRYAIIYSKKKEMSMKKILLTVLPSVFIALLTYLKRDGKDILSGIYIIFPILYILIGSIHTKLKWALIICLSLTTLAFLIPVNLLFNMGSCIDLAVIYNALAVICFTVKKPVIKKAKQHSSSE